MSQGQNLLEPPRVSPLLALFKLRVVSSGVLPDTSFTSCGKVIPATRKDT